MTALGAVLALIVSGGIVALHRWLNTAAVLPSIDPDQDGPLFADCDGPWKGTKP